MDSLRTFRILRVVVCSHVTALKLALFNSQFWVAAASRPQLPLGVIFRQQVHDPGPELSPGDLLLGVERIQRI